MADDRYEPPVTIERAILARSAIGASIAEWLPVARVFASRRGLRGAERWWAHQVEATVDAVWRLRHPVRGLTPAMRLVDAMGGVWEITAVLDGPRGAGPELHTRRGVDA